MLETMNERGQYGDRPWPTHDLQRARCAGVSGHYDVRLGAETSTQATPWWIIWLGLMGSISLWGVAVALEKSAGARWSTANALWAGAEDRAFQKWLKTPVEDRRKWPEERSTWRAWEFAAQRIDDEAANADDEAANAAKTAAKAAKAAAKATKKLK